MQEHLMLLSGRDTRRDWLLAEATRFHRPSPFLGDGLYLISAQVLGGAC